MKTGLPRANPESVNGGGFKPGTSRFKFSSQTTWPRCLLLSRQSIKENSSTIIDKDKEQTLTLIKGNGHINPSFVCHKMFRSCFLASVIKLADIFFHYVVDALTSWLNLTTFDANIWSDYMELVNRVTFKSFPEN